MFGLLQTECGYTPAEIREMTAQDVQRLNNHWQRHPPLRVLVSACAAALGVKLPTGEDTSKKYMTTEEAKRFIRITQGRIPGVGGM